MSAGQAPRPGAALLTASERAWLARLALRPRRRLPGDPGGERRAGRLGQGALFAEHRAYTPGDDPRYVDWHVAARLGDLVVKRFEAEERLDLLLLVDRSTSMQGAKALTARRLAAALGHLALDHQDRVLLSWLPAAAPRPLTVYEGPQGAGRLLADLAEERVGGATNVADDVVRAGRRHRRRAQVAVLSDFFSASDPSLGLAGLAAMGHAVAALHVLDPADASLPVGAALTAVDAESGESLEVDVTPEVVESLGRAWRRRSDTLARWCVAHDASYLRVGVATPLSALLRGLLAVGWVGRR